MAVEFKGGSRDQGHRVDLGIAHGEKRIAGQEYDSAAAQALLANFAEKSGFGDLRNVSLADRQFLVEFLNSERADMEKAGLPALPKLTES